MKRLICWLIGHTVDYKASFSDKEFYDCSRCGKQLMPYPTSIIEEGA